MAFYHECWFIRLSYGLREAPLSCNSSRADKSVITCLSVAPEDNAKRQAYRFLTALHRVHRSVTPRGLVNTIELTFSWIWLGPVHTMHVPMVECKSGFSPYQVKWFSDINKGFSTMHLQDFKCIRCTGLPSSAPRLHTHTIISNHCVKWN